MKILKKVSLWPALIINGIAYYKTYNNINVEKSFLLLGSPVRLVCTASLSPVFSALSSLLFQALASGETLVLTVFQVNTTVDLLGSI